MVSNPNDTPERPPHEHDRYEREHIDPRIQWLETAHGFCENFVIGVKYLLQKSPPLGPLEAELLETKKWLITALETVEGTWKEKVQPQLERVRAEADIVDVPTKPDDDDVLEGPLPPPDDPPPQDPSPKKGGKK